MDKTHYWFLNAVIQMKLPLNWLSAGNLEEMINKPGHTLSSNQLVITLEELFEERYIYLSYLNHTRQERIVYKPTRQELEGHLFSTMERWIMAPEQVYYGMTALGGTVWEQLSKPQWERYFDELYDSDPHTGEIIARTSELAEQVLWTCPYLPFIEHITPNTEKRDVIQPWHATYWKILPEGYRIRFMFTRRGYDEETPMQNTPAWLKAWNKEAQEWYTNYLELN